MTGRFEQALAGRFPWTKISGSPEARMRSAVAAIDEALGSQSCQSLATPTG